MNKELKVAIVMGSDSDLPTMIGAARILEKFGIGYELDFVSAHRTPAKATALARSAAERGLRAIIAGAGGAAHLAGVLAAETVVPVIGVPIVSSTIGGDGLDAVYSILQMPPGIPVATVGRNRAENAGILAAQIIGTSDKTVYNKLLDYKKEIAAIMNNKSEKVRDLGPEKYLMEVLSKK